MRYTPAQQITRKIVKLRKKGFDDKSIEIIELNKQLTELRNTYITTQKKFHKYPVKYNNGKKDDINILDIIDVFQLIKSKDTIYKNRSGERYNSRYTRNTYTPSGIFYGKNSIRKLNNLLLFQIYVKALTISLFQKIISDEYTFAAYYEFEDKVINIFVQAESVSTGNILVYQNEIQKHYERNLKNSIIECPEIYIVLPLTHDYNLYCNTNSTIFKSKQ
jgi:hypothetical protein